MLWLLKVVNVYMGVTINIIDSWETFKAAKTAVSNTIQTVEISRLASSRAVELQVIDTKLLYKGGHDNISSHFKIMIFINLSY